MIKKQTIGCILIIVMLTLMVSLVSAYDSSKRIAYWKFNEGSGATATDEDFGRILTTNLTWNTDWSAGGTSLSHNGEEGRRAYINDTTIHNLFVQNYTIEIWMNLTNVTDKFFIYGSTDNLLLGGVELVIEPNTSDTGRLAFATGNAATYVKFWSLSKFYVGQEYHIAIAHNSTALNMYINGTWDTSANWAISLVHGRRFAIGVQPTDTSDGYNNDYSMRGAVDELMLWNSTRTDAEILEDMELYSSFDTKFNVTLDNPKENIRTILNQFNATHNIANGNLTNTTLYVWYVNTTLAGTNFTNLTAFSTSSTSVSNITALSIYGLGGGNYKWNYYTCVKNTTASMCKFSPSNYTLYYGFTSNYTYSIGSFETNTENITTTLVTYGSIPTDAYLNYSGTSYLAYISSLGSNTYKITRSLTLPENTNTIENRTINFYFTLDGNIISTNNTYQYVNKTYLDICSATLTIPFINFTFKDETLGTWMNASIVTTWTYWISGSSITKTLLFTNTTSNPSYSFCYSPSDRTIVANVTIGYYDTGFPQRTTTLSYTLTNTTTDKTLYLLGSSSGIYATIVVVDSNSYSSISGALVQVEKEVGGVWTIIEQGTTDSSGSFSFWGNPNFNHRITASKTGYATNPVTIKPSGTQYTLTLVSTTAASVYVSPVEGIQYWISPKLDFLKLNTTYVFGFNVTAKNCNLIYYNVSISNSSNYVYNMSYGTTACGSNISVSYITPMNTSQINKFYLRYYIDVGNGSYQTHQEAYPIGDIEAPEGSIYKSIKDFLAMRNVLESNREAYGRLWWFFLLLFIGFSAICYFTGAELSNPGIMIIILFFIILIASIMGIFDFNIGTNNSFINKYAVAISSGALAVGYAAKRFAE